MKSFLNILSVLIWFLSFNICNFFFEGSWDYWWKLRMILYAISYLLVIIAGSFNTKTKLSVFTMYFAIGIVMEDISDRLFFDTTIYEWNDFLALDLAIIVSLYLTFRKNPNNVNY
jgi:hypothetical protein